VQHAGVQISALFYFEATIITSAGFSLQSEVNIAFCSSVCYNLRRRLGNVGLFYRLVALYLWKFRTSNNGQGVGYKHMEEGGYEDE
jgi:hypothetical protein